MIYFFKFLIQRFNFGTPAGERLYSFAIKNLGIDASPRDEAPDEFGCAETVNDIVFEAFGDYAGGDRSTYRMYNSIKNNEKFVKVYKPLKGDIILSPTGYGNGNIRNGHVGIVGDSDVVMGNDSASGKFIKSYTLDTWRSRYLVRGGYPIHYFRRLIL